ncbi:MAG: shikimate kinase [Ruminococcaceae bacterium]|nr:shikimate kinase [Oscillospiraceae bacterium]
MKNIILIGMPGCGKTTIGKALARRLGREFIDSDTVFEETVYPNISKYFAEKGENEFRREETAILQRLAGKSGCIIATGGGVVERCENKDILRKGGIVVFVNRSPEDIARDVDTSNRPLLAEGRERIFRLFENRIEKYNDFCNIKIENNSTLEELCEKIINEVNSFNG